MSLFVRTAPPPTKRFSDPNLIPAPSMAEGGPSYRYITNDAMRIASVVACVGLRAGAYAQLPLKAYEDGSSPVLADPQPDLFKAPSTQRTVVPSVWKTQMSISRDIWGYAAGRIRGVDAAGYVSKVDWVCPDDIHAEPDGAGGLRWRFNGQQIDASLVFHVPSRWVMPGSPLGVSPLEKSGLVDLAKKAQDFGRDWFREGCVPSSILYSDKVLTGPQADDILTVIKQRWRKRQPAVIGSGMKYEQVSVKANESQFLETMQRAAADIAISFNLPPEMIAAAVASGSITYANREQNVQQYLMQSINPDLVVIQEIMGLHMQPGTYARWVTAAFLRADLATRYAAYKTGLEAEFLTVDEVRNWEELPPLTFDPEEGDDDQPA